MAKYGHVREGGKVGRSDATPTNFFSVDSNNLKSMSFKFGNDIFITFEMPGVAYSMSFDKIHISLQFRPSVIRGPCLKPSKVVCTNKSNATKLNYLHHISYALFSSITEFTLIFTRVTDEK